MLLNVYLFIYQTGQSYDAGEISITVGGDQLTRVNLDSAKSLRGGAHTPTERFEHLSPVVEELFHLQQDLLEVSYHARFEESLTY